MLWGHAQRYLLKALVVLVGLLAVSVTPAYAANPSELRSDCLASGRLSEDIVVIAAKTERWVCAAGNFPIGAERVLLRFEIATGSGVKNSCCSCAAKMPLSTAKAGAGQFPYVSPIAFPS